MFGKLKKFNRIVMILTLSDVLVWGTYLVAYPLQGIYMTYKFGDGSIQYITVGLSIYYFMRAILQVPIGYAVDKRKGDGDEIWALAIGCTLIGLNFIIFPFTNTALEYYLIMGMAGVGASFNLIGWRKLFARNLDRDKEGQEYAMYEAVMSLCTAIFSLVGGEILGINHDVFRTFFFVVGIVTILGGWVVVALLYKSERKSNL